MFITLGQPRVMQSSNGEIPEKFRMLFFTAHFSRHHNFSTIIHHGHIKIYVHVYETDFDTLFYIKYTFECFLSDFKDVISSVCISV